MSNVNVNNNNCHYILYEQFKNVTDIYNNFIQQTN